MIDQKNYGRVGVEAKIRAAVVGIMWCRNEADLLPHTIPAALKQVDCLMVIDDDSTDASWDVIKSFHKQLEYSVRRRDVIHDPKRLDLACSRQHLLDKVRERFDPLNTWVQVIESDTALLDTDVRWAIEHCAVDDVTVRWHMVNAVRRVWTPEYDLPRIPDMPLHEYFDAAHWMEQLSSYTYRPLSGIGYTERLVPWPQGFSRYLKTDQPRRLPKCKDSPLVVHYGFRSPTFYYNKMKPFMRGLGRFSPKNPTWDLSSPDRVRETVPFYNGDWNNQPNRTFDPVSREGWIKRLSWGNINE